MSNPMTIYGVLRNKASVTDSDVVDAFEQFENTTDKQTINRLEMALEEIGTKPGVRINDIDSLKAAIRRRAALEHKHPDPAPSPPPSSSSPSVSLFLQLPIYSMAFLHELASVQIAPLSGTGAGFGLARTGASKQEARDILDRLKKNVLGQYITDNGLDSDRAKKGFKTVSKTFIETFDSDDDVNQALHRQAGVALVSLIREMRASDRKDKFAESFDALREIAVSS